MNLKSVRRLSVMSVCVVVWSLLGCGQKQDQAPQANSQTNKDDKPRPVRYIQVGMSATTEQLVLPGEIRPRYEQRYGFRVSGKIAKRLVDVGDVVRAGQELAVLDAQDVMPAINAQAALVEVANTDFKLQQSELKRQRELKDKGFISEAAFERQLAAVESTQARLLAAQAQLANIQNNLQFQTLRADHPGVVTAVDAEAGSVIGAGQSVIRVAQLGEKEVAIQIPERVIALARTASGFVVTVEALGVRPFQARLRELAPMADPASRTYSARLSLLRPDESVRLGMSATVQFSVGSASALIVPRTALYTRDEKSHVWLIDQSNQTVRLMEVKVGASDNDRVTISNGLKPGDLIVIAGANLLLPGQKVRLLDDALARPAP
jgi:membrane fusion protein, multidrug efflux system